MGDFMKKNKKIVQTNVLGGGAILVADTPNYGHI